MHELDKEFSPILRALMAEWMTFFSINRFYEVHGDDYSGVRHPSAEAHFNNSFFIEGPSGPFDYHCAVITELGVVKPSLENNRQYFSECKYREIWGTIFTNINTKRHSAVSHFFQASTDWAGSPMTPSESISFTIDDGCKTLFKQFEKEGFVRSANANYFWTEKMRPILEHTKYWKTKEQIRAEQNHAWQEKIRPIFSTLDIQCLEECALRGDIISAVAFIRTKSFNGTPIDLSTAKRLAEYMFPSVWRVPVEEFHWVWHADIPSKFTS